MNVPNQAPLALLGIITRDRVGLLRKAIVSAMTQTYLNVELHVVNDGSSDETRELAKDYRSLKWTDLPRSKGYRDNRNALMRKTNADYFVSLDDDAWFLDGDEIQCAIDVLEKHADVAAIAFDILSPDRRERARRNAPRPVGMFIGCGHVVRLSAVHEAGGYVKSPGDYGGEEKDLALRLMDAGYKILLLPGVHVWHDKTTVARDLPSQHRSGVCNDLAMTMRRTPLAALPAALIGKVYRHYFFARQHDLDKPFRDGLKLFFKSIPELWSTRQPVRLATLREYRQLSQQ